MSEQIKILEWFHNNFPEDHLSPSEAYQKYTEETGYDSKQKTFNNLLAKLADKGLLEKPERGKYRVSENGKSKANYIQKEDLDQLPGQEGKHQEIVEELVFFLEEEKKEELQRAYSGAHELKVELSEIEKFDLKLAEYFEEKPERFQEALEEAIETASEYEETVDYSFNIDVGYYQTSIFEARDASKLGRPITIEGTINNCSEFYPEVIGAIFECVQCSERYYKEQDAEKLRSPYKCDCGSRKFETVEKDTVNRVDLKISDRDGFNEEIKATRKENQLSEKVRKTFKPGKNIRISGVVKEKENDKKKITPYLQVLDFEDEVTDFVETIEKEDREEVREKVEDLENSFLAFSSSLAPNIVCAQESKQVIAASLIGAESGDKQDGRIHSFIVSNPGMGKSDLLEFVQETFQDTFLSDGKNATGPGLVGTVEKEDGRWTYSAGKIVQADGGILLVDEFDKMDGEQATALNRPMSSGTVEMDKGSENLSNLPAYAAVIAAGNFTNYVDEFSDARSHLPEHASSLMDRWDLLLAVRKKEEEESNQITEAILDKHSESGVEKEPEFSQKELVIYREMARETAAYLSESAKETIRTWLHGNLEIAELKGNSSFGTDSNRYVETLAKLTKMFAKSEFREKAGMKDAKRAVKLLSMCKESLGLTDGETYEEAKPVQEVEA